MPALAVSLLLQPSLPRRCRLSDSAMQKVEAYRAQSLSTCNTCNSTFNDLKNNLSGLCLQLQVDQKIYIF